ncbi:unnamed protein product [Laminaria digitata]
MVNVIGKRCSHDSCNRPPYFTVEGSKTAAYCKQHAQGGMVDVVNKHCSHASCYMAPRWGGLADRAAIKCSRHKGDILGGPVINFRALCKVAGCGIVSRWGLDGKQPTHCRDHGPLEDGLVCIFGTTVGRRGSRIPSYGPVKGQYSHAKPECTF